MRLSLSLCLEKLTHVLAPDILRVILLTGTRMFWVL